MKKMNVVIVNDDALGYGSALLHAFNKQGTDASLVSFNERGILGKLRKTFFQKLFEKFLLKSIINKKPTSVLFLCGELNLKQEDILKLKKRCVSVGIWFYDDLYKYYAIHDYLNVFDFVLSFNPLDVEDIKKKLHTRCEFMPLFYDENLFKNDGNNIKKFELSFIGSIYGPEYSQRRSAIYEICQIYEKSTFFLCTGHSLLNVIKILRDLSIISPLIANLRFRNLSLVQVAKVYRETKFVLNINGDNQNQSVPMRIYEALAAGSIIVNIVGETNQPLGGFKNIINIRLENLVDLKEILSAVTRQDVELKKFSSSSRVRRLTHIMKNQ